MPRTFGRAQLNKQLEGGIELHEARQMLQQQKRQAWNWRHVRETSECFQETVRFLCFAESRKLAILNEMNVDEFLPAP